MEKEKGIAQENAPGNEIIHSDISQSKAMKSAPALIGSFTLNKKNYQLFKTLFKSTVSSVYYSEVEYPEISIIAIGEIDTLRNLYMFLNKHKLTGTITITDNFMYTTQEGELAMAKIFIYDGKINHNEDSIEILKRIRAISLIHTIITRADGITDYSFTIEAHNIPKLEKIIEYFNTKIEKESVDSLVEELCQVL